MDIEKLIERLYKHHTDWGEGRTQDFFEVCLDCKDAATALSTLQAENEKLRETVDKYATAARVIALHLKPFCDESLPYDEMIADAARKASDELEQVKRERDAIEQDFRAFTKQWWEQDSGFPCRWCKFENSGGCEWKAKQPNEEKICAGRAFEWRGQKED